MPGTEPAPELARLYASITALAEVLTRLLAAGTEATEPGRGDLRVAK